MEAHSIKAIAEYLVTTQSSVEEAMHDFWSIDFLNDVKLVFGRHAGQYLSTVPGRYQTWIADEVAKWLSTHSVHGVSMKVKINV
mgnify:CR=1 FL=1